MIDTDAIRALIADLEEAEAGSRELDFQVAATLWPGREGYTTTKPGSYTTSLDAALTLVPEGAWNGEIRWHFGELQKGGYVELNLANPEWLKPDYDYDDPPHAHAECIDSYEDQENRGPEYIMPRPLALALCIAALKARLAET